MPTRFLDTNVLVRHITVDDPIKARAARELLLRVERGEEQVASSPLVVFETIFTLQSFYQVPKQRIRALLLPLINMPGLSLPDKRLYEPAFDLWVQSPMSFADAYNSVYMQANRLTQIYSWDTDFDRVPGITRLEP
jgi:predicted nucleic acid-binding protein